MGAYKRILIQSTTTKSASFVTDSKFVGNFKEIIVWIHVFTVTGTNPTLDADVQITDDSMPFISTYAADEGTSFAQMNASGHYFVRLKYWAGSQLRLNCTIGGTDSPSFQVIISLEGIE